MSAAAVLDAGVREEIKTSDSPGDSAHIVLIPPALKAQGITPQALVLAARVEGFPITALCGYTWVPSKDPKPLPTCSRCLEVYQQDGENRDEREELPDA